ncbi:type II secretion system protein [Miniphocaeibacter halophilus]|uniref:type II secretion system protein n=1 Tax=Miniphocaeibacter halophilus TaxID=2931922 RepID=UPI001FB21F29|nr:type II secretion system protein [Miniphocaeibacter halophilus]
MKKKENKGFTLLECIVGLAIIGILAAFLLPSLANALSLEIKTDNDKELISYSKHIMESIKSDIYNEKTIGITNDLKKEFKFEYSINKTENLNKLKLDVWRVGNEEDIISYEVLLP